jgi:hypothetical protein
MKAELRGINPNTRPMPVPLKDYCSNPSLYSGNLIEIHGIACFSTPVADSRNLFCWAGNGCDSLVLYLDGDAGIHPPAENYRCHRITGIVMRMHVPDHIAPGPMWCLAPRFRADILEYRCSSEAVSASWGEIKVRFSE